MENYLISLSFALIAGLLFSRLAKRVGLPAVTAYLLAGLFLGPYVLGSLGLSYLGFGNADYVSQFEILSKTALGFIAFAIGNEFRIKELKLMGKGAVGVGILQAVITTLLTDAVLIVLHFIKPELISMSAAITLGAIAAATAPAATLMVVRQYKASGPLTKLLLVVVAIDDAVGLMLFSISFGIATVIESGVLSIKMIILEPIIEIFLSLLLGFMAGLVLTYFERYFHSRSKRLALVVGFVLLVVGISLKSYRILGTHFRFSLLLVCMFMSATFCNCSKASIEIMDRLDRWTAPINIIFFVLSGAELNLRIILTPYVLMIGIIFITVRSIGKISGSYFSCKYYKFSPQIQQHLGITLLPQAGVALGMANTARVLDHGDTICNIVLFAVLIYELVGPSFTKMSLIKAGEINLDERKSSRKLNPV